MEWYPIGEKGIFTFDEPYTRHGDGYHMKRTIECNSLNVFNPIAGEKVGLGQHGIAIFENRDYLVGIVARSETGVKLSVSLTDRWGKVEYDCRTIQVETENWTRYEGELRPDKSDPENVPARSDLPLSRYQMPCMNQAGLPGRSDSSLSSHI